jgi:hypothetical protein
MKYLLQINDNIVNKSDIRTIEKLPILGQEFLDENHTVQELSYSQVDDESIPLITVHTKEPNDEILGFFDDGTDEDSYPGQSTTF